MTTSAKAANLVEVDGIEPLGATLLNNAYRVTAGNGEQAPLICNTLPAMRSGLASGASGRECVY